MATITWPLDLPQVFLMDGYQQGTPDNLLRDDFDMGPAGVRQRQTAAVAPVQGSMDMTTAQWESLLDFMATDLGNRSLAFGFPAQRVSTPATWLVRITEPPMRAPNGDGDNWLVTLVLEVLP